MSRQRYWRRPRRGRPRQREWWLLLPFALVIALVILGSRLPEESGALPSFASACPAGDDCAPAAAAAVTCASGGTCDFTQGASLLAREAAPPAITGQAAAVIEEPCGGSLYDLNANQQLAPASLTKIATALVAYEHTDLSEIVDVQVDGQELVLSTDSTIMGLQPGLRLSVRDLLYGLLLPSGNDAAIAIAEHLDARGPAFVGLMNDKVAELGLSNTHFTNPHGLDEPDLYTSAFDIAMLGRELVQQPELAAIVRTQTYQPAWDGPPLWNSNRLVYSYPGSLGVKIGYTDAAGQAIVAAAERDGKRFIVSVLGSSDIYGDAVSLLDWAFDGGRSVCSRQPSIR